MAKSTKLSDQYNEKISYVAKDLIWKDHISKIESAQRAYDKKWGFLNDSYAQNSAYDTKRSGGNSLANARSSLTINSKQAQQHAAINPSPRPVPLTTNRLIGWKTTEKNYTLEKYGRYARGQESLHKKFKWPIEGCD